jgi:uncharacterized glyoxalase superfamily protein PhnB
MIASSDLPAPSLVPLMRYRDVSAAIDWLCSALGFEKQVAVSDPDGGVYYAQLTYGNSLIMLGSVRDTELDKLMRQPDEVGGIETQSCYLVVEDADAHYARATAAGAEIVLDIKSDGLGRRGYSCKDPEGHIWNFGTYNPWKTPSLPATIPPPEIRSVRRSAVAAVVAVFLALALGAAWWITGVDLRQYASLDPPAPQHITRTAPEARQPMPDEALRESFAGLRASKEAAELSAEAARKDLSDAQAARQAAEEAAQSARADLDRERAAKEAALRTVQELEAKITAERSAKDAAARTAADAKLALEKERMAKEALERGTKGRVAKPPGAEKSSSENTAPASGFEPGKGAQIETSATQPATAEASEPPKSVWIVASEGSAAPSKAEPETRAKPRTMRKRAVKAPVIVRFKPTYITDLHDVPWPYNIWYRTR